jgi:poly(A) polymerase
VRIIRAVRFAAKLSGLGFALDPKTAAPLAQSQHLLQEVPQSRMFDEMLKLLQTGHALATVGANCASWACSAASTRCWIWSLNAPTPPWCTPPCKTPTAAWAEGKRVAPSFLLACVLWQDVREGWQRRLDAREHAFPALQDAIDEVFNQRIGDVSGRGKLAADMREIWVMQPRFEKRVGRIPESMVAQLRFRAGFDFMRLRADVGEVDEALADWWQKFSTADEDERYDLMEQAREEQKARSRQAQGTVHRVPPRTKAADPRGLALDEGADNHAPDADTAPPPEGSAPQKTPPPSPQTWRRRRRQRPPAADA